MAISCGQINSRCGPATQTLGNDEPNAMNTAMRTTKISLETLVFHLCSATLSDAPAIASIASTAYLYSALTWFLSPSVNTYIIDYYYGFERRIRMRMIDPHNISVVAIVAVEDDTEMIIGYAQFIRLSSNAAALALLEGQDT